jgi:hypothetical protein
MTLTSTPSLIPWGGRGGLHELYLVALARLVRRPLLPGQRLLLRQALRHEAEAVAVRPA